MSHFAVLVATQSPADVEAALQPYHEYECTGVRDQYVKFVIEDEAALRDEHAKLISEDNAVKEDFGQWVRDYHDFEMHDGKWGRWTNPNKKWDWWVVGGRWSNSLYLRCGAKVDQARKVDVDIDAAISAGAAKMASEWDAMDKATGGDRWTSWVDILGGGDPSKVPYKEIEEARPKYWNQPALAKLKAVEQFSRFRDLDDLLLPRAEYILIKGKRCASMFALLHNGQWHQRGQMGWWASVSDDKGNSWDDEYFRLFDAIPNDHFVTVVDCHI